MRNLLALSAVALVAASAATPVSAEQQNLPTYRSILCNIDHVAVIHDRMHLKCGRAPGEGGQGHQGPYYAMEIAGNEAKVDAIVKLAIASKDPNGPKPMRVWYRRHASGNPPGCDPSDCRQLVGAAME